MPALEGHQTCNILRVNAAHDLVQLLDGAHRVPQNHRVDDESKSAKLALLTFAVDLSNLPRYSMESGSGKSVTALVPVELSEDATSIRLIIG